MGIEMGQDWDGLRKLRLTEVKGREEYEKRKGVRLHFVRDDKVNVARKRNMGYEPVNGHNAEELEAIGQTDNTDSSIRVGDSVLMEISEERHQQLKAAKADVLRRRRKAAQTNTELEREGRRHGVRTHDESK